MFILNWKSQLWIAVGYNPFIFEPTETTHGGTGFYIRDNINFIERSDIELTSPGNFESKFIEIKFENKNLVIGCIYRHPNSQISVPNFCEEHLDPILIKIANDNKQCILMGDFNVNLLKSDSDTAISLFYNTLTSHHYSPFVLQPTRLRSKTLIDNIVFNSQEWKSFNWNIWSSHSISCAWRFCESIKAAQNRIIQEGF